MKLALFTNGLEAHYHEIVEGIRSDGYYIKHEEGHYYTVGFADYSAPECVILNVSFNQAKAVLASLFEKIQRKEVINSTYSITNPFDLPIRITELEPSTTKNIFFAGRDYFGHWRFDAVEVTLDNEYRG